MNRIVTLALSATVLCGCSDGSQPVKSAVVDNATAAEVPQRPPNFAETVLPKVETVPTEPAPTEYNALSDFEAYVILEKGTERRFVGEYTDLHDPGTYICRQCNAPLFKSEHKFSSDCGWPSFDDEIQGAVKKSVDEDGYRTEIICSNCGGHLGHVFDGEGFTQKNTRHCVNSVSMKFISEGATLPPVIRKR